MWVEKLCARFYFVFGSNLWVIIICQRIILCILLLFDNCYLEYKRKCVEWNLKMICKVFLLVLWSIVLRRQRRKLLFFISSVLYVVSCFVFIYVCLLLNRLLTLRLYMFTFSHTIFPIRVMCLRLSCCIIIRVLLIASVTKLDL